MSWPTLLEHLGLDAEQDHVRVADGVRVRGDGPDAVLALQRLAPLGARVAGDDLVRGDQAIAQQAGDHRLGHHARADRRDRRRSRGGTSAGV